MCRRAQEGWKIYKLFTKLSCLVQWLRAFEFDLRLNQFDHQLNLGQCMTRGHLTDVIVYIYVCVLHYTTHYCTLIFI